MGEEYLLELADDIVDLAMKIATRHPVLSKDQVLNMARDLVLSTRCDEMVAEQISPLATFNDLG